MPSSPPVLDVGVVQGSPRQLGAQRNMLCKVITKTGSVGGETVKLAKDCRGELHLYRASMSSFFIKMPVTYILGARIVRINAKT
jgi:hypothetical protein